MRTVLQDLRFSLRLLALAPSFTAAAIVVLALGIGANTAIFSLVHELLWSDRPFSHPQQIVQLYTQDTKNPGSFPLASHSVYLELAAQNSVFNGILAHHLSMVGIGEKETSRRTFSAIVTDNYVVPAKSGSAWRWEQKPTWFNG